MLKKFAVSLLTLAFLSLGAGSAFGATAAAPDPAKLAELKALHQQMVELKVQMLDKQVEAGILEKEKAAEIKAKIEHHQKRLKRIWLMESMTLGKGIIKMVLKNPKAIKKHPTQNLLQVRADFARHPLLTGTLIPQHELGDSCILSFY